MLAERLHLAPGHRGMLEGLLHEHLPDVEVWAYGSRVSGRSHDGSDLDLVLRAPGLRRIEGARLAGFREALRQSNLPFLVEARDWARLPPRFHREIEREHVVLVGAELENCAACTWPKSTLGDLIDLRLSSVDKKTKPTERPVRLCNYLDVYKNQFIHSGLDFMNGTATAREISNCTLHSGDVVITKDSEKHDDIGVPALVREDIPDLVCGYHLAILRSASSNIDGAYLFYALNTHEAQKQFHSYANGVTRFGLRKSDIGLIEIPLPPLSEQRAIGDVLGVLDERIEVHRRMNETLEAMAQALFKDWFIDFGPTRAKTAGHKPYLPKPLWNLFPNNLTNSKLGQIPEGWGTWRLDEIAEHRKEAVDPSREPEAVFEHYSIPAYDAGRHPAMDEGASIKSNKSRVPQHTVLLSKLNPDISRVWVPDDPGDAVQVASTEFLPYVPREGFGRGLLSALFRSLPFREVLQGMVTGTSRSHQRVPPKALNAVECLVGRPEHFSAFEAFADAALRSQMRNRREIRTLTALRDTLLPKLISGKIRIQDCAGVLQSLTSSEPDSPFKGEA